MSGRAIQAILDVCLEPQSTRRDWIEDLPPQQVCNLSGLEHMTKLEEFWANSNCVDDFKEVDKLGPNTGLLTVYLEHNPLQVTDDHPKNFIL